MKYIKIEGDISEEHPFGDEVVIRTPDKGELVLAYVGDSTSPGFFYCGTGYNGAFLKYLFPDFDPEVFPRDSLRKEMKDTFKLSYNPADGDCPYLKAEDWKQVLESLDKKLIEQCDDPEIENILSKFGLVSNI